MSILAKKIEEFGHFRLKKKKKSSDFFFKPRVHGILTFAQIRVPGYTKFRIFFQNFFEKKIFFRENLVKFTSF